MTSTWVRRSHRWLAVAFTAIVILTVIALALSGPVWVSYLPLFPLAGLFLSGSVLFVRYYTGRSGAARRTGATGTRARTRGLHRWAAVVFVVTVVATVIALSLPEPIVWVSYLPLIPLAVLLFSGLSMLVTQRLSARRRAATA
ncbi:hypothetical protein ATM97_14080 [Nocardia sp. MH4]|uniref:hypothetical protein n=1 Tax=Nocardia sp. MH4 TaxID=1768677 RepID=UPI001C502374|nr:hypothetical protein [Nocardia sp. MH4]MBW0274758.1 hypothetical protein [Nocardia sp. MH4]